MRRRLLKILGGLVLFIALSLIAGWLAFVPWPREPGFEFVMAWGGHGRGHRFDSCPVRHFYILKQYLS